MIPIAGFSGHLVTPSFVARQAGVADPEIERRWRAAAVAIRNALAQLGPASSVRRIFDVGVVPFTAVLGFDPPGAVRVTDHYVAATINQYGAALTLLTVPWAASFDRFWRSAVDEAQRRCTDWCLLFNGPQLRIVEAARLYRRRYVECDLPLVLDQRRSFASFLRVVGGRALFADAGDGASLHAVAAQSDRAASEVCRSLRDGVLAASADVLRALIARERRPDGATVANTFEQSLTIVYRMVFLLFAEARALVPMWHPIYRDSYSVEALRDASEQAPDARGFWDTLRAISRLAHVGCHADDLRVTPFNGRLFSPAHTPLAERRGLDDGAARRAVLALSTRPAADRTGRERIVYRELGVEQLGAVYETLLDYKPHVGAVRTRGRRPRLDVSLVTGSGLRKATGTFYTPQPVAEYLVRRTLAPLVREVPPEAILALRIVDPAMGSGAFLVAACRYLTSAYEHALVESGAQRATDFGEDDRTTIRRLVAERCVYGVDLNPMAVQLARLSLWLTSLAADRPLSFLDHRLMVGDSLLGVSLSDLRRGPLPVRRRGPSSTLPLFSDEAIREAMTTSLPVRLSLEEVPNDTVEQVRTKERALGSLMSSASAISRWKRIADVWCASWFGSTPDEVPRDAFHSLVDAVLSGGTALSTGMARTFLDRAAAIARSRRFFHWELEFPEVFFDSTGQPRPNPGFDAVIGNPPWDMMRADAARRDDDEARTRERADVASTVRFIRDAGVFHACGQGHGNRYQLFTERAMALTRAGGRIGLVLPAGLAADHGSAALRRALFGGCDLDAVVGVDNVRAIFPIHRSVRFLLATATAGQPTERFRCRFGVDRTTELEALGEEGVDDATAFPVELTPAALERIAGRSLAIPYLRRPVDLQIAEKASTLFAPLGSSAGWSAAFGRELNATDDRNLFRDAGSGWPVLDGKHLEPFRVECGEVARTIAPVDAKRLLGERAGRARLAYRDVASATNRVTLIGAILPPHVVSTHTIFCLRSRLPSRMQNILCGLFNSLVVNYLVRQRVTTHVTTAIVEQLPIPRVDQAPGALRTIGAAARLLARRQNAELFAALNAQVARIYQLSREEFAHVLSTFPLIPEKERTRALNMFLDGA